MSEETRPIVGVCAYVFKSGWAYGQTCRADAWYSAADGSPRCKAHRTRPATAGRLEPALLWQLALAKSIDGLVVGDAWETAAAIKGRLESRGVVLAVDPVLRDTLARAIEADSPLGHGTPVPEEATLPSGDARVAG